MPRPQLRRTLSPSFTALAEALRLPLGTWARWRHALGYAVLAAVLATQKNAALSSLVFLLLSLVSAWNPPELRLPQWYALLDVAAQVVETLQRLGFGLSWLLTQVHSFGFGERVANSKQGRGSQGCVGSYSGS